MDRRERNGSQQAGLLAALIGHQTSIWTAMPGIIQSFNPTEKTAVVLPALKSQVQKADGSKEWVTLPLLLDCPVFFPSGGGATLTFPLRAGDECLVVFASRCIDAWWNSGGVQIQAELRMHDLSDGFVFAGVSSKPHVPANISTTKVQLRTDDGLTHIELDPVAGHVGILAAGNLTAVVTGSADVTAAVVSITAPAINLIGAVNVTGALSVTGALMQGGKNIGGTHVHSGVTVGTGNTGAPV